MPTQQTQALVVAGAVIAIVCAVYMWPRGAQVAYPEMRARYEASRQTIWPAAGRDLRDLWAATNQVTFAPDGSQLKLESSGTDPFLASKPELKLDNSPHVLKVVISVPEDTGLQVFFSHVNRPGYDEQDSISVPVGKGWNEVYLPIPAPETLRALRLDPGALAGPYILKEISIRKL